MKCLDCGATEGTMATDLYYSAWFWSKDYSYAEMAEMTPVCACCGSENIEEDKDGAK